ncbi:MAG: hypothetical protein ACRDRS_09685, partial [Pseudonocardiaceae bacterium]
MSFLTHKPRSSCTDGHVTHPQAVTDHVRRTFTVRKHATLAALRRDGSPRISGTTACTHRRTSSPACAGVPELNSNAVVLGQHSSA